MLPIESPTGGHAPGKATDSSLLEIRDTENIGSDDSDGVGGVHKEAVFPKNHVAILVKTREKQLLSLLSTKRLRWQKLFHLAGAAYQHNNSERFLTALK